MSRREIVFSPVTRLSGHLSLSIILEEGMIQEANISGTMFRGYEWIMQQRKITDAVYLTQRICGICSLAHGAVSSYLLDQLYDNEISENAQYLRNIMFGADFLQNHIRHFYLFCLPDYVKMPDTPPLHQQNNHDFRLSQEDNRRLSRHYFEAIKAAQQSHELLSVFGGKAPHQHSFVHGGVAVGPDADKVNRCLSLIRNIQDFVRRYFLPDMKLIAQVYDDYYQIGNSPGRFFSAGAFRFGDKNETTLWPAGIMIKNKLEKPDWRKIRTDVTHAWFKDGNPPSPDPYKEKAYSWIKAVNYQGLPLECGPLARLTIKGLYQGGTSTMDRLYARAIETHLISQLIEKWLLKLKPGPAPIKQKDKPVRESAFNATDAMRGFLSHSAVIDGENIVRYEVITPTMWNFSPKTIKKKLSPVEDALTGTSISHPDLIFTTLGRIIRSFDPCISCATHVLNAKGNSLGESIF